MEKELILIIRGKTFGEREIPVIGFNHGIAMPLGDDDSPSGKVVMQDFTVIKYFDANSPLLHLLCCKGEMVNEIILQSTYLTESFQRKPQEINHCEISLSHCYITSVSIGSYENQPSETLTCSFRNIRWEHEDNNEEVEYSKWNVGEPGIDEHFG